MSIYTKDVYVKNKISNYYKNKYSKKQINCNLMTKRINNRRIDTINKIYSNLINRIYKVFTNYNIKFDISYEEIIGCSLDILKDYLQNKFLDNMSFDNYGDWEVDHIIPISSFKFIDKSQILKCFNYTNLQPLWKIDNRKKYTKTI